jgi:hypothetical protein
LALRVEVVGVWSLRGRTRWRAWLFVRSWFAQIGGAWLVGAWLAVVTGMERLAACQRHAACVTNTVLVHRRIL